MHGPIGKDIINKRTYMSRLLKTVLKLLKAAVFLLALMTICLAVFAALIMENNPTVQKPTPPTSQDVVEARAFVRGVRSAISPENTTSEQFVASEAQLNSVIKLGSRLIAGFRGQLAINGTEVTGVASIPVPYTRDRKWLNVRLTVPAFEGDFALSQVELGGYSIPPKVALGTGRVLANTIVGDRFGDRVLSAATSMQITEDRLAFGLMMDEMGSNGVMRGIFGTLRGADMPDAGDIDRYYLLIRTAMDEGQLPQTGSYLPYLQFALAAAFERSQSEGIQNAYTSAIFALTMICGAQDFPLLVGNLVGDGAATNKAWKTDCGALTLNGRIDTRRHFTTAAALQAASNRGFAVSIGEFKELYDVVKADGFDFTDIAANGAGIEMSNSLMSTPNPDWPMKLARLENESDVIVSFDGLPTLMSQAAFEQNFQDIESPQYAAVLAIIEARIDALSINTD